jgi:hypothetical protein
VRQRVRNRAAFHRRHKGLRLSKNRDKTLGRGILTTGIAAWHVQEIQVVPWCCVEQGNGVLVLAH